MQKRTGTGRRRSSAAWRELVEGFVASGLTLAQYCAREGICTASFYRWRRVLSEPSRRATTSMQSSTTQVRTAAAAFVDLGALSTGSARVELRLDLGGGVMLQIARG